MAESVGKPQKAGYMPRVNVINIEETIIEGRVHKPEAFYILQRSGLNYKALEPAKSFIPRIFETVKKDPF